VKIFVLRLLRIVPKCAGVNTMQDPAMGVLLVKRGTFAVTSGYPTGELLFLRSPRFDVHALYLSLAYVPSSSIRNHSPIINLLTTK
jgi:hypothetical protein